jgi:hypothetical protein
MRGYTFLAQAFPFPFDKIPAQVKAGIIANRHLHTL